MSNKGFCVTRLQLLVFWTKFFGAHIPLLAEEGCPRHQKDGSRSDLSRTGGQFGGPFERPAGLTTITASRYRARASRPSAPLRWLRGIFLMAHPPLLGEEGNAPQSSVTLIAKSTLQPRRPPPQIRKPCNGCCCGQANYQKFGLVETLPHA